MGMFEYLFRRLLMHNVHACVFNHTTVVVTPTDSPKSVRDSCVIDVLVAFFLCCHVALGFVAAFVIGLSQISSFFSHQIM